MVALLEVFTPDETDCLAENRVGGFFLKDGDRIGKNHLSTLIVVGENSPRIYDECLTASLSQRKQTPEHYYSEEGVLFYGGPDSRLRGFGDDTKALATALDKIYQVPEGATLIDGLITADKGVTAIQVINGYGDAQAKAGLLRGIKWDPGYNGPAGGAPFTALAHELKHAFDIYKGTQVFPNTVKSYTGNNPPWEAPAVAFEDKIRGHYGLPLRNTYNQDIRTYYNGVLSLDPFQ